ncbi:DUF3151 domain-containing protein [Marinactinospora thermotolerans]|uniref:DUF3151 domain-containing protein n=1 Tax=Marinactinospora thermotolerans DSM 45154 TaxID=1122192 RepID=A0A1T4R4C7_9ACTN|nr:DUF3151 domain-containing protein [Marinactinospora thermotolerans]SKA10736.1 Protein of unknown function [Marinactinospora thermotolerans DSM 45154]
MDLSQNLLGEPPATRLPENEEARAALAAGDPAEVAARFPAYSAAWATLAERALAAGDPVAAYAYARTGYHRGLDQLRRSGWKGHGPIPWEHEANRGFLRSLHALGRAAAEIGETDEAERCSTFLRDSSAEAAAALSS